MVWTIPLPGRPGPRTAATAAAPWYPDGMDDGSIAVIALLMLIIFLSAAALSVDLAYIQLVQTQLRSATDSAAQAAVEAIAEGKTVAEARATAKQIASLNKVAGDGLILDDADSAMATGLFPIGITMATLTVSDGNGGIATCDATGLCRTRALGSASSARCNMRPASTTSAT